MRVTAQEFHLVSKLERVKDGSISSLHAPRIIPYPFTSRDTGTFSELNNEAHH